mmetsp:Transcript_2532/g.7025  ORF Transcript_2532/g.7025 Transcript_2532/m.7025 type:complete len:472 (-) Transcript_2532:636-2051(-)
MLSQHAPTSFDTAPVIQSVRDFLRSSDESLSAALAASSSDLFDSDLLRGLADEYCENPEALKLLQAEKHAPSGATVDETRPMGLEVRMEYAQRTRAENIVSNLKKFRIMLTQFTWAPDGQTRKRFSPQVDYRIELLCKSNVPIDTIKLSQACPPQVLLSGDTVVSVGGEHSSQEATLRVGRPVTSYIYRSHKLRGEREAVFRLRISPVDAAIAEAHPALTVITHPFKIVTKLKPPDPHAPQAPLYDAMPVHNPAAVPMPVTSGMQKESPKLSQRSLPVPLSTQLTEPFAHTSFTSPLDDTFAASAAATTATVVEARAGSDPTPLMVRASSTGDESEWESPRPTPSARRQRSDPSSWRSDSDLSFKRRATSSPSGTPVPAALLVPVPSNPGVDPLLCQGDPDAVPSFDFATGDGIVQGVPVADYLDVGRHTSQADTQTLQAMLQRQQERIEQEWRKNLDLQKQLEMLKQSHA